MPHFGYKNQFLFQLNHLMICLYSFALINDESFWSHLQSIHLWIISFSKFSCLLYSDWLRNRRFSKQYANRPSINPSLTRSSTSRPISHHNSKKLTGSSLVYQWNVKWKILGQSSLFLGSQRKCQKRRLQIILECPETWSCRSVLPAKIWHQSSIRRRTLISQRNHREGHRRSTRQTILEDLKHNIRFLGLRRRQPQNSSTNQPHLQYPMIELVLQKLNN